MNLPRAVILGVVGGAFAAWFASASTSAPRQDALRPAARPTAVEESGADLAAEIQRLHERLHPTAAPSQPARNLFEFGAARAVAPAPSASPAAVPDSSRSIVKPAEAPLTLVGVAEDGGKRTAIISGAGDLAMAGDGERIGDRYTVVHVDADAVELTDSADGRTIRLTLK